MVSIGQCHSHTTFSVVDASTQQSKGQSSSNLNNVEKVNEAASKIKGHTETPNVILRIEQALDCEEITVQINTDRDGCHDGEACANAHANLDTPKRKYSLSSSSPAVSESASMYSTPSATPLTRSAQPSPLLTGSPGYSSDTDEEMNLLSLSNSSASTGVPSLNTIQEENASEENTPPQIARRLSFDQAVAATSLTSVPDAPTQMDPLPPAPTLPLPSVENVVPKVTAKILPSLAVTAPLTSIPHEPIKMRSLPAFARSVSTPSAPAQPLPSVENIPTKQALQLLFSNQITKATLSSTPSAPDLQIPVSSPLPIAVAMAAPSTPVKVHAVEPITIVIGSRTTPKSSDEECKRNSDEDYQRNDELISERRIYRSSPSLEEVRHRRNIQEALNQLDIIEALIKEAPIRQDVEDAIVAFENKFQLLLLKAGTSSREEEIKSRLAILRLRMHEEDEIRFKLREALYNLQEIEYRFHEKFPIKEELIQNLKNSFRKIFQEKEALDAKIGKNSALIAERQEQQTAIQTRLNAILPSKDGSKLPKTYDSESVYLQPLYIGKISQKERVLSELARLEEDIRNNEFIPHFAIDNVEMLIEQIRENIPVHVDTRSFNIDISRMSDRLGDIKQQNRELPGYIPTLQEIEGQLNILERTVKNKNIVLEADISYFEEILRKIQMEKSLLPLTEQIVCPIKIKSFLKRLEEIKKLNQKRIQKKIRGSRTKRVAAAVRSTIARIFKI